jgi:secernin
MCDTVVAIGNSTKDGSVILGKNSNRVPNEAHNVEYVKKEKHPKNSKVKCTYISVPQIEETYAVLLLKPFWMFGCEMGANEYGVVIGNEAVYTREPYKPTGLLGMDLLRLGIERGKTAKEALHIIIELLEKHGQGGNHWRTSFIYHNSFIIADHNEAYIMEAAGDWWIVEIVKDFRSISNIITIRGKGDLRRDGIIQYAVEKGYCKDDDNFDFALTFSSEQIITDNTKCSMRQLGENKGVITPQLMMEFLREHDGEICRHNRSDTTTGSMVSSLNKDLHKSIHWFTGSMLPCLSIFKPYIFPIEGQRVFESKIYSEINHNWFWNKHADFVKRYIRNPKQEKPDRNAYISKLRSLEQELIVKVNNLMSESENDLITHIASLNEEAWTKSEEMIK